jgi:hypothetical protein
MKKLTSLEMKKCKGGLGAAIDALQYGCPLRPIYCCYIIDVPGGGQMAVMTTCTTAPSGKCMCGPNDACPI